jgi:putative ABC transport system substrate-binding protein
MTDIIGVYMNLGKDDPEAAARIAALEEGLKNLDRAGLQIECRYGAGTAELRSKNAAELVALSPKVIHAASGPIIDALQQEMRKVGRTIPIVFAGVIDPVDTGRIPSLERPGNVTGVASIGFSIGVKWLALLKFVVPSLAHAVVVRDPRTAAGRGQLGAIADAAKTLGVKLSPVDVGDVGEIERAITAVAGEPNGGLLVTAATSAAAVRQQIIALAAHHRLPAVHPNRMYATEGGLIAYGPITVDLYRSVAGYVDRILRGTSPAKLPAQQPMHYELAINLKTAKALGMAVPPALVLFADRVIK